jgi:hypothetical protein
LKLENTYLSKQEAQQELERLSEENAEMEERLIKLQNSKGLVTKAETDQIKKLHQVYHELLLYLVYKLW